MENIYENLARAMADAKSIDDLQKLFEKAMSGFDLDYYTYQLVNHQYLHNLKNFFVTTYPKEWELHYIKEDYFTTDPLVNKFQTSATPFMWGTETFKESHNQTRKMMTESGDFNLQHGIGIPIPGPNKSFSILTLCSKNSTGKELSKVYDHYQKDLLICGLLLHSSFLSLNLDNQLHCTFEMTNKELECLKWICAGKSNTDIAAILGVTVDTIKDRNKNIYKKLGVDTRTQAIVKAYRYKMVE